MFASDLQCLTMNLTDYVENDLLTIDRVSS